MKSPVLAGSFQHIGLWRQLTLTREEQKDSRHLSTMSEHYLRR